MDQRLAVEPQPPPLGRLAREAIGIVDRVADAVETAHPGGAGGEHDRLDRISHRAAVDPARQLQFMGQVVEPGDHPRYGRIGGDGARRIDRSEEHTSELPSLMRISYAVFCLKKKTNTIS